jgi:hypothetical protein
VNIKNLWKKQQFEICGKNNTLKFVEKTTIWLSNYWLVELQILNCLSISQEILSAFRKVLLQAC